MASLKWCLLLFFFTKSVSSECRKSYATICDSFDDLKKFREKSTITDLVVGSEIGDTNALKPVHLMNSLVLSNFNKLKSLIVLNQINQLELSYAYECTYKGKNLRHVLFHGNIMKQIDEYHFPVFAAERLTLTNNKIERITGGAFTYHDIVEFDVSDNLMEVVEVGAVPSTEITKVIAIKNNRLTHLEPNCFPASLKSLNLENNILRYIEESILASLLQLQELVLSKNKLKAMPKISHLQNLVNFQIASNEITEINSSTFGDLKKLKYIDLSNNKIVNVDVVLNINTPLKDPYLHINLALNRLRDLNLKEVNRQEQVYVLYGNPFDCDKWNEVENLRGKSKNQCEEKFISSGKVPFCINYRAGDYAFVTLYENDIDRLLKAVKNQEKKFECNLIPNMEYLLSFVSFGCVA